MAVRKKIHRLWIGPSRPDLRARANVWRRLNPGWEVQTWAALPAEVARLADLVSVPDDQYVYHASNVFRYWVLREQGGVWVDCDVEPLLPIEPALERTAGRAFVSSRGGLDPLESAGGYVMGGAAGDPFFDDLLSNFVGRSGKTSGAVSGGENLREVLAHHPEVYMFPSCTFAGMSPQSTRVYASHKWEGFRAQQD